MVAEELTLGWIKRYLELRLEAKDSAPICTLDAETILKKIREAGDE